MKPSPLHRFRLAALALLLAAAWTSSCNDGPEITGQDSDFGGLKSSSKKKSKSKHDGDDGESISGDAGGNLSGEDANLETDDGEQANAEGGGIGDKASGGGTPADTAIDYPTLDMLGQGVTTCKGKFYPTTAQFTSALNPAQLVLNLYNAHMSADSDKVEKKANEKIAESIGMTNWVRVSKAERDQLKTQGFDYATYAIFAKSVTKQRQGQTFNFDKPLPVFPWPAPASRYDDLVKAGQKTWKANVTGSINSPVTVTLQKVGGSGDEQVIKFTTTIQNDTNRSMYEMFPLPREATFVVNSATQDVRQITELHWYLGDDNCDGNPEQVQMTYKLCKKVSKAKNETYNCQ